MTVCQPFIRFELVFLTLPPDEPKSVFLRCLKAGMKPELVDASFRRKTFNKKHNASFEEPILIDNFRPLEKDDISDFLQVFWNFEMQILFLSREEASAAHLLC